MSETTGQSGSGETHPSWESMDRAYEAMGLDSVSEAELDDDKVAYEQYALAEEFDAEMGHPGEPV